MEAGLLQRLAQAATPTEREAIILEMSLSALPAELQAAVQVAAVPHWFDVLFLEALLDEESDDLYDQLLTLNFVEQVPGKGYAIHERTRLLLLAQLWQNEPGRFQELSQRAAAYCVTQASHTNGTDWSAEALYHQLLIDPEAGIDGLRRLATQWANYEFHTYDEIEYTLLLAQEHLDAGRLSDTVANWVRLWQAKLALLLNQPGHAAAPLSQITTTSATAPRLAAETAETEGDLFALQGNETALAEAWEKAYTLYQSLPNQSGRLDAYLVAEKMRQHGLSAPEAAAEAPRSVDIKPSRDAQRLIDNIESAWIEGVLKTALNQQIDLRLAKDETQTSNLMLHRPQGIDRPVMVGQRLSRLFAATGNSLLILGAPGSGKTITLLQLLAELLEQARADGNTPIPLLFNLSSFAAFSQEKEANLMAWLAEQAYTQYRLKRQTTRADMANGRFTLLLDGLDEVSNEAGQREQCVAAINTFMQQTPCGLAVCSRIGDYQLLHNRLNLTQALVLEPLGNQQIELFISQAAASKRAETAAIQYRIRNDWQLREALRSPLLLNLYPQAFRQLAELETTVNDSVEARRQTLFAAYVETVFTQTAAKPKTTIPAKSKRWLTFLANRMQEVNNSLFYVEDLQPTWLAQNLNGRYRGLYGTLLGLIGGLIVGLIVGLNGGLSGGLIFGLIFGLSGGLGGGGGIWLTTRTQRSWLRAGLGGLSGGLIFGLVSGLSGVLSGRLIFGLSGRLIFGLIFGLGLILAFALGSLATNIELRERVQPMRPSRRSIFQNVKQGIRIGLSGGLIFGLIVGLISGLSGMLSGGLSEVLIGGLILGLIGGMSGGLIGGMSGFVLAFLDTPTVDERPHPGTGAHASLRNALLMTALAALFLGLPAWYLENLFEQDLIVVFLVLANILPPTFTWFGGLALCQHCALRFILSRRGLLPWRLVPWLEEMVARGLLRRVGGGYIFIHRSLLEYFAALEGE